VPLPARPRALLVGLGGGTQVHLLHRMSRPRLVTVIERDPAIVRIALRWFGLERVGPLEFVCDEAAAALGTLARARRRFDFVMEDAAYAADNDGALPIAEAAAALVAPGGALVVNRHRRSAGHRLARALRARFASVRLRRVRRDGENVLVCCVAPRPSAPAPADAIGRPARGRGGRLRPAAGA
jgi:spermidine synthase